jgi:hypothetical protein
MARPSRIDVVRTRGDTSYEEFTVYDKNGAVQSITGCSFLLTTDTRKDPADASTMIFQIAGVIFSGVGGIVRFTPTTGNAALVPGTYYFDIQMTDGAGIITTIVKGKWIVEQDITK